MAIAVMTEKEVEAMIARADVPALIAALIAALREANALSEARNVEMERALKQSCNNNKLALEWQRRYEWETITCERVMAERDKAESALREANAQIAAHKP